MTGSRTIAVLLLGIIAIAQAIRFALGWPVTIGTFAVPLWVSAVAALVVGAIAVALWRDGRRQP